MNNQKKDWIYTHFRLQTVFLITIDNLPFIGRILYFMASAHFVDQYTASSPSPAQNISGCASMTDDTIYGGFDAFTLLSLLIASFIGFVLGSLVTGMVMMLTFNGHNNAAQQRQQRKRKGQRKGRQEGSGKDSEAGNHIQIAPINDPLTSEDQAEKLLKESEQAHKSHQAHMKRRGTKATNSVNARLAIRKQQLEMKLKRAHALEKVTLFHNLSVEARDSIFKRMKLKVFQDDDEICVEGDEAKYFFIVAHLEDANSYLQVTGKRDFEDVELNRLGLFDFVGESALVDGALRTASVKAVGRVETLTLTRNNYKQLLKDGVLGDGVISKIEEHAAANKKEAKSRGSEDDEGDDVEDDDGIELEDDDNKDGDGAVVDIADY